MRRFRPARAALYRSAALFCLLSLVACEDPSGVGISFAGGEESDPSAQVLHASSAGAIPLDDPTGAFNSSGSGFASLRALVGIAADPLFGTTAAQGYLDVLPQSVPEGFRDRPVLKATLRLLRSYAYGDTTTAMTVELQQIAEEWSGSEALADTTFPVLDGVITRFDVSASDSLIEVPMPQEWVEANDATLRNANFSTLFHGFRLRTDATSGAVYGFSGRSSLELINEQDTVRFVVSELFSNIEHEPTGNFPDGLLPVQDGTSTGLGVSFVLDTLGVPALNTAFLRVNADTLAGQASLPNGFVRPLARELALYGTFDDGTDPVLLSTAELDTDTQRYSFSSTLTTSLLQELILNRTPVDGFAIGVPPTRSSIDAVALVAPPSEDGPRAVLVLIPSLD